MDPHKNFAYSTVATAPSPATSGTSLIVQSGEGARFAVGANATVCPVGAVPTPLNSEIVRVTAVATDTFTITRTQESTSARTIVVGDAIFQAATAKTFTDIETDLASADSQIALQAAQIAAQQASNLGYYVYSSAGLLLSPGSGGTTKLDMAAGTAFFATTELNVAAQAAISTTIASLADVTNPKWVAVELDGSAVVQFNQGTAAAAPAFPTPSASRVVLGWLYVPASATNVDTALTTPNGNAKLIDARIVCAPHPPRNIAVDGNVTITNPTTFTSVLTAAVTIPANSLNVGDRIEVVAGGAVRLFSTSAMTFALTPSNGSAVPVSSMALDATNFRRWTFRRVYTVRVIGASAIMEYESEFEIAVAGGTAAEQLSFERHLASYSTTAFNSAAPVTMDLQALFSTGNASSTIVLRTFSVTKTPA